MLADRVWYRWEERETRGERRSPHRAGYQSAQEPQGSRVENAEVIVRPNAPVVAAVIVLAGSRPQWIDLAATGRAVQVDAIAVESPGNAIRPGPIPAGHSSGDILRRKVDSHQATDCPTDDDPAFAVHAGSALEMARGLFNAN